MVRGFQVFVAGTALSAVMTVGASVASAQDPPPAQPEAQKPALTLEGDAAYLMVMVKPDRVADFEMILNKTKEALSKSEKPERKKQAETWRVFKLPQQAQGSEVYYFFFDPPVPDQEYDPIRLIFEVFPSEAKELFDKFKESRNTGGGGSGLKFVMKMSQ
jgi:hypothetical protein